MSQTSQQEIKKRKVDSSCKDNIWDADLADMHLITGPQKGAVGGASDHQILAKVDLYPIDNNSEKKKGATKYKPYKIRQKLLVTLLLFT